MDIIINEIYFKHLENHLKYSVCHPVMLSRYNPNSEVLYKGKTVKYSNSNDLFYEQNAYIRHFHMLQVIQIKKNLVL